MGEAGLELMVANLLVARLTFRAFAATADEGNGDAIARLPSADVLADGFDDSGQFVAGTWGSAMSLSCPTQPCQSLRQTPVAWTRTTTPCASGAGSGTIVSFGGCENAS